MIDLFDVAQFNTGILTMELIAVGVLGLMWGSYLNVCIYRLPIYRLVFYPVKSFCPGCGKEIRTRDNIPVLSFLLLKGRCRYCGMKISPRYAVVEMLTAAIMLLIFVKVRMIDESPLGYTVIQFCFFSALIIATFTDLEHWIIPDETSIGGAVLAPIVSFLYPALHVGTTWIAEMPRVNALVVSLAGAAVGAGAIWGIGVIGKIAFRKDAMGFGDVKLLAFFGGILGYEAALMTIFAGALITLFYVVIFMIYLGVRCGLEEVKTRGSEVPFGPGLCTAAALFVLVREPALGLFGSFAEAMRVLFTGAV